MYLTTHQKARCPYLAGKNHEIIMLALPPNSKQTKNS